MSQTYKRIRSGVLVALFVAFGIAAPPSLADWPTPHGDLQRSGFYDGKFVPRRPLKLVWRKELYAELTGPRSEVVVGDGLAFMGTYAGRVYAWDAKTGDQRWIVQTDGPIGHSPMFADGILYVGSMDGHLYAIDARGGCVLWRFQVSQGIFTSPVVHEGMVLFGARDGVFYAILCRDGQEVWRWRTGAHILTTASITPDGRRVVFASEDMHAYCLDVRSGKLVWRSRKMHGLSVRDYWPTIVGGLAILTTNPVYAFHDVLDTHQNLLIRRTGFDGNDKRYVACSPGDVDREQEFIVEFLKNNPTHQTTYAFKLDDGQEPWVAGILYTAGLHNPPSPPCFNRQTGEVFVNVRSAYTTWDGGGEVRPLTGVGRLDLMTGRVALIGHGYESQDPQRPPGRKDMPWMPFSTIGDETQTLACAPGMLYSIHQGFIGSLDFKTGLCRNLFGKRDTYGGFYGPGNFGWASDGGFEMARQAGQPFGIVNEWHGPARAIASISDGYVYYPVGSQVICAKGD